MTTLRTKLCCLLCFCLSYSLLAQLDSYEYKREIGGIAEQWHQLSIPNGIFAHTNASLTDLRVYGITEANDTIEAPYILSKAEGTTTSQLVDFKSLNTTKTANGYYYTYEVSTTVALNEIKLDFGTPNFDWRVSLEGSQDNREWFTIKDKERLLAIKNSSTDYKFTTLRFPNAQYQYYRVYVQSKTDPLLRRAKLSMETIENPTYRNYGIKKMNVSENKEARQTQIYATLDSRVPLSSLKINTTDAIDYYRSISIQHIVDSVETEKGWRYTENNLYNGTLSSLEKDAFLFNSTLVGKLHIQIQNQDNAPLQIESIEAKGYMHTLKIRFGQEANYYLAYGKAEARAPQYDLQQVSNTIPTNLKPLSLGELMVLPKATETTTKALFENSYWLWAIMGIIILVLGWFSLKMIQKK